MSFSLNILACHACLRSRGIVCATGPCPCPEEPEKEVHEQAAAGSCPLGLHDAEGLPRSPAIPLAGDLLESALHRVGIDRLARLWTRLTGKGCGCAGRRDAINRGDAILRRWLGM